jgi:hypothetical protein
MVGNEIEMSASVGELPVKFGASVVSFMTRTSKKGTLFPW